MKPGPVLDFLLANQGIKEPRQIDWVKVWKFSVCNTLFLLSMCMISLKANSCFNNGGFYQTLPQTLQAKRMLKNMRIKTRHNNLEFKILGISEMPCNQQRYVFNFIIVTCLPLHILL